MTTDARPIRPTVRVIAGIVGLCVVMLGIGVGIGAAIWSGGDDDAGDVAAPAVARADEAEADEAAGDSGEGGGDAGDDGPAPGDDAVGPPVAPDDPDGEPAVVVADVEPQVVQSEFGPYTQRTFHWSYHIPAGSALFLPEFRCPSEAPYVRMNGTVRGDRVFVAEIHVDASSGVGYGGFNRAITTGDPIQRMHGWIEGTLLYNSLWAPVFDSGTADVSVTCTEGEDRAASARAGGDTKPIFPWVP